ncbi:L,D-transpeptidase [Argonema galeatum]|uniref:L,D-transpeptidase n=1 Tax=Argonema galeatum TaxID=2942762 RepID=UPI0020129990|nr:L,D-transpeptidase [Argonema galeatum]MCL1467334.1 L,D-transpeptidase [Argonema galeatum A003/A1]
MNRSKSELCLNCLQRMKGMVRGESLSRNLMLFCFGAVISLSSAQRQATASILTTQETTKSQTQLQSHIPAFVPPSWFNPTQNTNLTIKLSDRRVYVYRDNRVQSSYPIAVGKAGWETPTGTFKVLQMLQNPAWEHPWTGQVIPPGPNNPLGVRWIAFWTDGKNMIGFHGTPNEQLIGQAVSHGCVRMRNRDVMALYQQVTVGTTVTVQR